MAHLGSAYAELLSTALNQAFIDAGEPHVALEDLWINKAEFTEIPFTSRRYSGLGATQTKPEGTAFPEDEIVKGNQISVSPIEYGKKVVATWEALRRDQHDVLRDQAGNLGRSMAYRKGVIAYSLINNADDSTASSGFDGLALQSASHTNLYDNTTWANRPTGTAALSETALLDSDARLRLMVDSASIPMSMAGKWLHYRPTADQTKVATRLLGQSGAVGSADNDINTVTLLGFMGCPSELITSTTRWMVMAEGHDLWLRTEVPPEYSAWDDPDTTSTYQAAYMSLASYFRSPRGCDGSAGA